MMMSHRQEQSLVPLFRHICLSPRFTTVYAPVTLDGA